MGKVAGWGRTKEGGTASAIMRKATVHTIQQSDCRKSYSKIEKGQICAGIENVGGKDSCQGDSGGALWHKKNGKTYQVGIVSSGIGCARPNAPGIYISVKYYRNWIAKNMKQKLISKNKRTPLCTLLPFICKYLGNEPRVNKKRLISYDPPITNPSISLPPITNPLISFPPITFPNISIPINIDIGSLPIGIPPLSDCGLLGVITPLLCPPKPSKDDMEAFVEDLIKKELI